MPTVNGNGVDVIAMGDFPIALISTPFAAMGIIREGGVNKWSFGYYTNAVDDLTHVTSAASVPAINTWYVFEIDLFNAVGIGYALGYLDDVLIFNYTGLSNNSRGNPAGMEVGADWWNPTTSYVTYVYSDLVEIATSHIGLLPANSAIIYPTVEVKEATKMPSITSAVIYNQGCRLRHVRHSTVISPWTAQ